MIKTAEQAIHCDAFGSATWNFVESIYDYSQQDKSLLDTRS
jgi:hypothetical protein